MTTHDERDSMAASRVTVLILASVAALALAVGRRAAVIKLEYTSL
jgi:hypothetical protein